MSKISKVSKREQLKHQFQQQMLSNYYLSRYQVHMSKLGNQQISFNKQKISSPLHSSNNPNRQFYSYHQNSATIKPSRKNFKQKLRKRKRQNDDVRKQTELFTNLSKSLQKQLNSRVPTKIQNGSYHYIEIVEQGAKPKPRNFSQEKYHLNYQQKQDNNCYIVQQHNLQNKQDSLNNSRKKNSIGLLTNEQIEEKIKAKLSKKLEYSPGKSRRSSPSRSSQKRSSPVRSIGGKQSAKYILSPSQILQQKQQQEKMHLNESFRQQYERETSQRLQKKDRTIDKSYYSDSKNIDQLKNQNNHNFTLKKSRFGKDSRVSRQMEENNKLGIQIPQSLSEKKSMDRKDQPSFQLRESTHDISNISRFSMNSEEGNQLKQYLCQQLEQNQFGPYQNALLNLRDLIEQQPNAWPIFVVVQRILEDRKQYEIRKLHQQQTIQRLQKDILRIKRSMNKSRPKNRNTKTDDNQKKILKLIRKLANLS